MENLLAQGRKPGGLENLPDPAVPGAGEIVESWMGCWHSSRSSRTSWMRANDARLPASLLLIRAFLLGKLRER
ncbi:MAG: hypothetical protein ABR985_16850 [Methanotrichaceae archaeon]|jgi:hypothetical protein